jgi:hypothetical protein
MGAKPGANLLRPRPTQRDPLRAFAQVRTRGPRFGFAQTRAYPPRLLRDEEAAGSNPATPTEKFQLDAMIAKCGDHGIDHLLATRWRDRTLWDARSLPVL